METTQIVSAIILLLFLALFAPRALRMNMARGKLLRNIAIWLALFAAVIAVYQWLHPTELPIDYD